MREAFTHTLAIAWSYILALNYSHSQRGSEVKEREERCHHGRKNRIDSFHSTWLERRDRREEYQYLLRCSLLGVDLVRTVFLSRVKLCFVTLVTRKLTENYMHLTFSCVSLRGRDKLANILRMTASTNVRNELVG